jgi:hypothetical protein
VRNFRDGSPVPSFGARMSLSAECGHWSTRATRIVTGRAAPTGERVRPACPPTRNAGCRPLFWSTGHVPTSSGAPARGRCSTAPAEVPPRRVNSSTSRSERQARPAVVRRRALRYVEVEDVSHYEIRKKSHMTPRLESMASYTAALLRNPR